MKLLLDTHIFLWWLRDDGPLSAQQREELERAAASGEPVGLSAISLWEIAKATERGRLELRRPIDLLFDEIEADPGLRILPLSPRVALESCRLGPTFHRDPADQILAATARVHGLRLVTSDERIHRAGVVATVG